MRYLQKYMGEKGNNFNLKNEDGLVFLLAEELINNLFIQFYKEG